MNKDKWSALTAALWCLYVYLKWDLKTEGEKIMDQKLGDENIKKVLGGVNAVASEIAKVAKDGIQAKDVATIVEDILTSPELKSQLTEMVSSFPQAIAEAKDIDVLEGIDVAKFEYEGVKNVIDELKK